MKLEISNAGLASLNEAISETGISPGVETGLDYSILTFDDEHKYAVMKIRLCLFLWTGHPCPPV